MDYNQYQQVKEFEAEIAGYWMTLSSAHNGFYLEIDTEKMPGFCMTFHQNHIIAVGSFDEVVQAFNAVKWTLDVLEASEMIPKDALDSVQKIAEQKHTARWDKV